MGNKLKFLPTERKKITRHPCYNIQPWLTSWNICCCRVMFVWQTIDNRVWYWQWTLKNYISTGHTHIYPLVILLKYSTSGYHFWSQILSLLFLKTDVVAQLLMLSIVELLKSYTVLKFLKLEIVVKILKLSRVAEFLISVRSKVLFIKALLAIVYCIAQ